VGVRGGNLDPITGLFSAALLRDGRLESLPGPYPGAGWKTPQDRKPDRIGGRPTSDAPRQPVAEAMRPGANSTFRFQGIQGTLGRSMQHPPETGAHPNFYNRPEGEKALLARPKSPGVSTASHDPGTKRFRAEPPRQYSRVSSEVAGVEHGSPALFCARDPLIPGPRVRRGCKWPRARLQNLAT